MLMGPDSSTREVLSLVVGSGRMFQITPKKGEPFVVSEHHILALMKPSNKAGQKSKPVFDFKTAGEMAAIGPSRNNYRLLRAGVDYQARACPVDPYFLGVWLGDGDKSCPRIISVDREIGMYMRQLVKSQIGCKLVVHSSAANHAVKRYRISGKSGTPNPLLEKLRGLGVVNNKHIPDLYLYNSRDVRLQMLAGLIDTDGNYHVKEDYAGSFRFTTSSPELAQQVETLCRSLGFGAYKCLARPARLASIQGRSYKMRATWEVSIVGNLAEVPTKIKRKRANERVSVYRNGRATKNVLHVGFSIKEIDPQAFYGFQVDGDKLYLMGDFTVTHNCGSGKGYALKNVPEAIEMKKRSKVIFDSAGDQNATENVWVQKEAEKRGLKVNYVFVHADPKTQWAHPERGVVKRAGDPNDGRMVDAKVFADSYAIGAKNHQAFYDKHKNNENANFVFLSNMGKPTKIDGIPKEALGYNSKELEKFAVDTVNKAEGIPRHVKRGALVGQRIWKE